MTRRERLGIVVYWTARLIELGAIIPVAILSIFTLMPGIWIAEKTFALSRRLSPDYAESKRPENTTRPV